MRNAPTWLSKVPDALPPNTLRLLLALIEHGPAHRAELARQLNVSRTTVTNLSTELLSLGFIEQLHDASTAGNNSIKHPLATTARLGTVVSVVFNEGTCTVLAAHLDGRPIASRATSYPETMPPQARLELGIQLVHECYGEAQLPLQTIDSIHVGVDTHVDTQTGDIYARQASARWYGCNPLTTFREHFGAPVLVQNSIRLASLAEALWGAGAAHRDVLFLSITDGVTSSYLRDGAIITGLNGGAGEFGHMVYQWNGPACPCGNRGCTMQYLAIPSLLRDYAIQTGNAVDWPTFAQRVIEQDPKAVSLADRAALVCARTLVNIAHLIDPEVIVIHDVGVARLHGFMDAVREYVSTHTLPLVARNVTITRSHVSDLSLPAAQVGIEILRRRDDLNLALLLT